MSKSIHSESGTRFSQARPLLQLFGGVTLVFLLAFGADALLQRDMEFFLAGIMEQDAFFTSVVRQQDAFAQNILGLLMLLSLLAIAGSLRGVAADAPFTVDQALRCAEAADAAIAGLGHAKPGDKTILDALNPAVDALRAAHASNASIDEALDAAARAAHEGAESTASMIAAVGRASRLGERSRGLADPGASSFALIMDALAARA